MTINFYIIFIILFIFFVLIPSYVFLIIKNNKAKSIIAKITFFVYLIFLFIGTIVELDSIYPNLSFRFYFNHKWFSSYFILANFSFDNIIINLALMFPVGFFTFTHYQKHKRLITILISLFISIFIEIYQMILPIYRNTELLDILLNTISGLISAIYYNFLSIFSKFLQK